MERNNLLEVEHLSVHIPSTAGTVQAVRDVSFAVAPGEVLALVGESGCGKSILCKSVMKLLPKRASIVSGTIRADGRDITRCSEREMRNLRGKLFSMVFQDPLTALNPTIPIGKQIAEAVTIHQKGLSKAQVQERVIELMTLVGIAHPLERAKLYPYHFSGGMRQRCVLAMALAGRPKILFADEPTTSLDVTIQAQILDLLRDIQRKLDTATVFVSHDLGTGGRSGGGDVRRKDRGDWHGGGDLLRPTPPLHLGAASGAACLCQGQGTAVHHPRHAAHPHRPAPRRRLRLAERVCVGDRLLPSAALVPGQRHPFRRHLVVRPQSAQSDAAHRRDVPWMISF